VSWETDVRRSIEAAEQEVDPVRALQFLREALERLPEPERASAHATEIFGAIGEIHYLGGEVNPALDAFSRAVACDGGLGFPYLHLRLGQLRFMRGELDRARDELMRAFMGSGPAIFEVEDPVYYALIKDAVERPSSN
jgi:hypothetical protein